MTPAERAVAHVRALGLPGLAPSEARITVNFHPDRLVAGRTVAFRLAAEGVYRSQFETGISNGGLTAYEGGDRHRWEHRMFGGAYRDLTGRPIYGALDLARRPAGAAPRFGSCHLRLKPAVLARATFSLGDSVTEPTAAGTADAFGAITAVPSSWGPLDDYVEAQIHGGLTLREDVEAVVCDPSFRGTPTAAHLAAVAPIEWHHGFRLAADAFPDDLRGPETARLARALGPAVIDAAVIGAAAARVAGSAAFFSPDFAAPDSASSGPPDFAAFGSPADVLQLLKYVWHILVLRG